MNDRELPRHVRVTALNAEHAEIPQVFFVVPAVSALNVFSQALPDVGFVSLSRSLRSRRVLLLARCALGVDL